MQVVLTKADFDESYFDGRQSNRKHNAGYTEYKRHSLFFQLDGNRKLYSDNFNEIALELHTRFQLEGLKVLDIGCAKGFVVNDLRDFGVNAYGFDISSYAISQADDRVKPFLIQGNALTDLENFGTDEFDYVISNGFLECIDPTVLAGLIGQLARISKKQVHIIMERVNEKFYNRLTKEQWINNFNLINGLEIMTLGDFR